MLNRAAATPLPPPPAPDGPREAAMRVIAGLLTQRTGQDLLSSRAWRIDAVLGPLLRHEGLPDLSALVAALAGADGTRLSEAVIDALLNQETSFYRDAGVAELVADALAAQENAVPRRARIWSAGCATGQEPYSLAMLLADRFGGQAQIPDIVATDVSAGAIARARAGRYSQFEIQRGLPVGHMLHWFERDGAEWVASPALRGKVRFSAGNLLDGAPPPGRFDLILCRNVLLYFAGPTRTLAFARLAAAIAPDGVLMLGAGETAMGHTDLFVSDHRCRGLYRPRVTLEPGRAAA